MQQKSALAAPMQLSHTNRIVHDLILCLPFMCSIGISVLTCPVLRAYSAPYWPKCELNCRNYSKLHKVIQKMDKFTDQ